MSIDDYSRIIQQYGPPTNAIKMPKEQAGQYRGRVPDGLIDFWVTYGTGGWGPDFNFYLCDPTLFVPVLEDYFEGDPEFKASEFLVYGYDAFGKLLLINNHRAGFSSEDKLTARIEPSFMFFSTGRFHRNEDHNDPMDPSLDSFIARGLSMNITNIPWTDDEGGSMQIPAIKKLGPLEIGEIYGFFPPLMMGGEDEVDSLQRAKVVEYHGMLAQSGGLRLFDTDFDNMMANARVVRMIGPQE